MIEQLAPAPAGKRVLYIDNSFTFGGAINALVDLLKGLHPGRVTPVVLSAQGEPFLAENLKGVEVHHWDVRLPWVHRPMHRRLQNARAFRRGPLRFAWDKSWALWWLLRHDLPECVRLMRFMLRERIDFVHLNNGVNGMVPALMAAKLLHLPVVAHARGPSPTTGFRRRYATLPDRWISVSGSITENLVAAGVNPKRVDLVHDAIDLSVFDDRLPPAQLRKEFDISPSALVFGVFGRIIPWKGIREFIASANIVLREVPDSIAIVVGDASDGEADYYDDVVRLPHVLGISDRVRFTGFRRDVADLMRMCDVVVHSSISPEPFGLTVVEGMATGKPVVAANSGGPTEIIAHGETGLLVDPQDIDAFAAAIIAVLKNRELADALGKSASARARAYYSPDRYARDVEAVYERVLSSRPRRWGR